MLHVLQRGGAQPPAREGQLPPLPYPLHLCAFVGEKGSKIPQKGENFVLHLGLTLHVSMDKRKREKLVP